MNTTLTGFGILLVLALATALIGPFLVDWNAHRAAFEAQARAQLGVPVTIAGDIDARILPTPYLRLNDVTLGSEDGTRLRMRELQLHLGLTPMLRGRFDFDAVEMAAPRLDLKLDGNGRPVWSGGAASPIDADAVAVNRIAITDGAVEFADLSTGLRQHVDDIRMTGEIVSLQGPFKFEGTADFENAPYAVQLNTGRLDENGGLRTKLEIEAASRPLVIRADGTLQTRGERARYVGALVVQRPPPPALREAEGADAASAGPPAAGAPVPETWRMEGRVAADMRSVAMELFDFQYGPDERALKLTGSATMALGNAPRFDANVAARQLDFDRALRRGDEQSLTLRQVYERLRDTSPGIALPVPGRIGIDVQGAVIGGDIVGDVHAELDADPRGWSIAAARAKLPGATALGVAGRLELAPQPSFAGHVETRSGELAGLLHWFAGNEGARSRTAIRSLAAAGNLRASAESVAVDDLTLDADRASANGRIAWTAATAASRPRVEAALAARELRLDDAAMAALGRLGGGGDTLTGLLGKADLSLKLSAGQLQLGEIEASDLAADLDVTESALDIRRLSFDAPGRSHVSAKGYLSLDPGVGDGRLDAAVASGNVRDAVRLAQRVLGPDAWLRHLADRSDALSPADLRLSLGRDAKGISGTLSGDAGGTAVDLGGTVGIGADTSVAVKGTASNPNGAQLLAQLGVPTAAAAGFGDGRFSFEVQGENAGALTLAASGSAIGAEVQGRGTIGFAGSTLDAADVGMTVTARDLGTVLTALGRVPGGALPTIPGRVAAELILQRGQVAFANLDGRLGTDTVRGRLQLRGADWSEIGGTLAFDVFRSPALAALAFGAGVLDAGPPARTASAWPAGAVTRPPLAGLTGSLSLTADRFLLPGALEVRDASFLLGLKRDGVTVETFKGMLAYGRLTGNAALMNDDGSGSFTALAKLNGVNLSYLLPRRAGRPLATGALDLSADVQASGRSLSAMAATLGGGGTFTVRNAAIQGVDPAAFADAEAATERGEEVDAAKLVPRIDAGLFGAPLAVDLLEGAFTVASGSLRASGLKAESPAGALSADVSVDLADATLDASLSIAPPPGPKETPPPIVVRLAGPIAAPARTLDVTGFANFLGMRAVEIESRRVELMEAEIHERRMLNQRLRAVAVEKRWTAETRAAEIRAAQELAAQAAAEAKAEADRAAQAKAEAERLAQQAAFQAAAQARAAGERAAQAAAQAKADAERAAYQDYVRQEQARIQEERARRLREAAPAAGPPPAQFPGTQVSPPMPMPTPIIVAPAASRRSSLDMPARPPDFFDWERQQTQTAGQPSPVLPDAAAAR